MVRAAPYLVTLATNGELVLQLNTLRTAATKEFELRGPFPSTHYNHIMESTTRMLDAFHAMNVVIQKDLHATEGEAVLLRYTLQERTQLCTRISHLFQGTVPFYHHSTQLIRQQCLPAL
jgi:hypothetical protein